MQYSVISLNFISDRSEIRRLRVFGKIALPAAAHKKSFPPGVVGRKEKEPHDGGLSMPIKQSLVYRNSVSCGIRMTHHSAAPQLSVYYSVVAFQLYYFANCNSKLRSIFPHYLRKRRHRLYTHRFREPRYPLRLSSLQLQAAPAPAVF